MKKILCIILAISTLASMLVFGIVAANGAETGKVDASYTPEGTAITSAAEFAAMAADGKYYLANDITVDATWNGGAELNATATSNTAFTGTFDGNGKTVTTTAPLFANLAGTVKNLTVEGEIGTSTVGEAADKTYNAAVAIYGNGNITLENILNKANVSTAYTVGGVIAVADTFSTGTLNVKNCVNEGNLTSTLKCGGVVGFVSGGIAVIDGCENKGVVSATTGGDYMYVGGILGQAGKKSAVAAKSNVTVKNSVNNGKITADDGYCAGIVSFSYGHLEILDCVNNGEIVSVVDAGSKSAGIFCSTTTSDGLASLLIDRCVNYGTVTGSFHAAGIVAYLGNGNVESGYTYKVLNSENHGDIILDGENRSTASNMRAGGIVGYAYGGTTGNTIENCLNTGAIFADIAHVTTKAAHIGGIAGYYSAVKFYFNNNINVGTITIEGADTAKTAPAVSMLCYNNTSSNVSETYVKNNYSFAPTIDGARLFRLTGGAALENDVIAKAITAEQVASGELVYTLNEVAGKTIYYQDLATGKITLTPAADGSNTVIKNADGTYSNPVVEGGDVTTTPDAEVTTTPDADVTTTPEAEVTTTVPTPEDTTTVPSGDVTTTVPTVDGTTTAPADDDTTAPADNDTTTEKPADNTTAKPVDTTTNKSEEPEKKGCGGFVLAAQLVAILGAAVTVVVIKKK